MWSRYDLHDMRSLGCIILTFCLVACGLKSNQKPSVLLIAVEGLSSDQFFCGEADSEFASGLGVLCDEGVRFTHAFTPSTMSQASLVSLLTGYYPIETGIVHNGAQYLPENAFTSAEAAFLKNYRTAFFSGGAPIWSKSGLDQGFEVFEDNIRATIKKPYRAVDENFGFFLQWVEEFDLTQSFFSVIFLPDLQFGQYVTVDDLGQQRSFGRESQLREINESLAGLIAKLKAKKRWDNTYVILTGVNGTVDASREGEIASVNMHGEGTQVLLLVKPARKARDLGLNWSVDENVTLVDVGATFFEIFETQFERPKNSNGLDVVSLKTALIKPQVDWAKERFILSESAWPVWRGVGSSRFSLRQNNLLYFHDHRNRLFNTLTDRFEIQPLSQKERVNRPLLQEIQNFFYEKQFEPWSELPSSYVEKIRLYSEFVMPSKVSKDEIKVRMAHLIQQRLWDKQLIGWLARFAIREGEWSLLEDLGREHIEPLWVYIAKRLKGVEIAPPEHMCWSLLKNVKELQPDQRDGCQDEEFNLFLNIISAHTTAQKSSYEDKFIKKYIYTETVETIYSLNMQNSLSWDLDIEKPEGPRLIQLVLLLPEYRAIKTLIENATKRL